MTEKGILLAVERLNKLKYLDHQHLARVNVQVVDSSVSAPVTFLKLFHCGEDGLLKIMSLSNVAPHKSVKHVTYKSSLTDSHLSSIETLTSEMESPPRAESNSLISFGKGIVPFLARFGHSLQDLELDFMDDVDISFIARTCPLLKRLVLTYCKKYVSSLPCLKISNHLESVTIRNGQNVGRDELAGLLLSPNLREIRITSCLALCDNVLLKAFRQHKFRYLERLTIKSCKGLSKSVFSSCFLSESNALNYIEIQKCPSLAVVADRDEWLRRADFNNWDIEIIIK